MCIHTYVHTTFTVSFITYIQNLKGVRDRMVAWYHRKSFIRPSLRKLQRVTADKRHGNNQYIFSSRFSTLTRVLSVYKRMSSRCKMQRIHVSLGKMVSQCNNCVYTHSFYVCDHPSIYVYTAPKTHLSHDTYVCTRPTTTIIGLLVLLAC